MMINKSFPQGVTARLLKRASGHYEAPADERLTGAIDLARKANDALQAFGLWGMGDSESALPREFFSDNPKLVRRLRKAAGAIEDLLGVLAAKVVADKLEEKIVQQGQECQPGICLRIGTDNMEDAPSE